MSRGAIRNFIRMKPVDPSKPVYVSVDVEHIIAIERHGWDDNMTEIILSDGHEYISNESVEEFEKRLSRLLPTYFID
jgi:hypothetical protein